MASRASQRIGRRHKFNLELDISFHSKTLWRSRKSSSDEVLEFGERDDEDMDCTKVNGPSDSSFTKLFSKKLGWFRGWINFPFFTCPSITGSDPFSVSM